MTDPKTNKCRIEDGVLKCERTKKRKDGTRVVLASMSKRMDANCNAITQDMEGEEKEIDALSGFMDKRISTSCDKTKDKPEDY